MLAVNTAAIAVITVVVVYYMNEGAIGNIMGPVAIGVASSIAVSVITAVWYGQLKSMFGLNDWQKRMEDKQDRLLEGQERILAELGEIKLLLRELVAAVKGGMGSDGGGDRQGGTSDGRDSGGAVADSGSH